MTSSLVGSEMCIRDSRWLDIAATSRRKTDLRVASYPGISGFAVPLPKDCLLYTSDAADDM
eukprot:6152589-Prorocentrum_lima.AAC.1